MSDQEEFEALCLSTPDDLVEFIRMNEGVTRTSMKESKTSQAIPVLAVQTVDGKENGPSLAIFAIMEMDDRKYELMRMLGNKMYAERIVPRIICLITETWCMRREEGEKSPPPSECPDRKEMLTITAMNLLRQCRMVNIPISRDSQNNIVLGESEEILEAQSRLLDAFYYGYIEKELNRHASERN